jgi:hypothetical protein
VIPESAVNIDLNGFAIRGIRTGSLASISGPGPGWSNCNSWQSASGSASGTAVGLRLDPQTNDPGASGEHGWWFLSLDCSLQIKVWCVEDD